MRVPLALTRRVCRGFALLCLSPVTKKVTYKLNTRAAGRTCAAPGDFVRLPRGTQALPRL